MVLIERTAVLHSYVFGERILDTSFLLAFYGEIFSDIIGVYRCSLCVLLP